MTVSLTDLDAGILSAARYPRGTGAGVRVAVIDSGVDPRHSHIGTVLPGVSFDNTGACGDDTLDRLGHGTAVSAAILEKAPEAQIVPVKVFHDVRLASSEALIAAIDWAIDARVALINLSLGTANPAHQVRLGEALVRAARSGIGLVAAAEQDGVRWLPGSLPLAIGVTLDWDCPRDQATVDVVQEGAVRRLRVRASGFPRPIPGVPPERNLKGLSFAVANVTGLLCLHLSRGAA